MDNETLTKVGLGDFVKAVEQNKCPFCLTEIVLKDFRDLLSLREFEISGICQSCQDETFAPYNEIMKEKII